MGRFQTARWQPGQPARRLKKTAYCLDFGRTRDMIVFAHVPKTAGTSITGVLMRYLTVAARMPPSEMLLYGVHIPYTNLEPLEQLPGGIRLLTGHFRGPHYEKLLPHDPFIVASIRNPFDRFRSGLEHLHRLRHTDRYAAKPEMLEKGGRLLDELFASRGQRSGTRDALLNFRHVEVERRGSRRILIFNGRFVAKARIESTEVDRLCIELDRAAGSPPGLLDVLRGVNRQNVWPKEYFVGFRDDEIQVLRECFEECFDDELHVTASFRREIRSLFEPDLWQTFISGLLRPAAVAA